MEGGLVAQNVGSRGVSQAEAQDLLSNIINILAQRVAPYCWKLGGDDHDSLHQFLETSQAGMFDILQLCGIYGPSSNLVYIPNISLSQPRQLFLNSTSLTTYTSELQD